MKNVWEPQIYFMCQYMQLQATALARVGRRQVVVVHTSA